MRYLSFADPDGRQSVGALVDDGVVDLGSSLPGEHAGLSPMRRLLLANPRMDMTAGGFDGLPQFLLGEVQRLPLVPDPTKIVATPVNYLDHQAEMNQDAHIDALGVFLKAPSSVLGDGGVVHLPYTDRRFDQEGELAFVVGRRARNVEAADAAGHIAGYTCLLDMTMRGGEDRSTRKSFDTFTPVGPWLVTPDEVRSVDELRLKTWVNGILRQDADVSDLIWDVPKLLAYASSVMTLEVGDVVATGTPAGVGEVHDGDTVSVEVSRLGRLNVEVSARHAAPCPTKGANRGPVPPSALTPVRQR